MLKLCPSPDQLRQFLDEQLGEVQDRSLGDHVESCSLCQETLERLTEHDLEPGSAGLSNGRLEIPIDVDSGFLHSLKSVPPGNILSGQNSWGSGSGHRGPEPFHHRSAPDGYELLSELGRGGMGVVYKARQNRLDRSVAIKMVLAGAHATPRELDRFRREAEAIARLQHPNIVQIHEVGEFGGCPYLALEFVEGESLARRIHGVPQPARDSAELVETLARTMHAAHLLGIIHRDLKPANVLMTPSGIPKVTDFGLAKRLDGEALFPTLSEQFLGTPSYMAPEQAVRERPRTAQPGKDAGDAASVDIYSLGAILYEMLTGQPPFRAEGPLETLLQVLHEEPVAPSRLRPEVPRDLEAICLKCLEKTPRSRYGTALELAEDLRRFQDFEPVRARPIAATGRLWRWCRRKTALAIAAGLAAVAIAATIVLSISLAVYQYRANSRLGEAFREVQAQRQHVDRQASHLAYERGQTLCEQGDVAQGLLWFVRGLKNASLARDGDLERSFRRSLSAWRPRIHPLRVRCEQAGQIHAAVFSPDGRTIALAGDDNLVQIRNAATGEPVGAPFVHPMKVGSVVFSPDGRRLLTGCDDSLVRLWDIASGAMIGAPLRHQSPVLGVAFSPDGQTVLTGSTDRIARLWNVADGKPIGRPMTHDLLVDSVAFSPDGRTVLTGSWDKTARLWDARSGDPVGTPMIHQDWVSSVAYSPDGRTIITGCYDRTARLWDRATCRPIGRPLQNQHCVHSVAFGPGGKTVLTGGFDGIARLWETETGKPIGPPLRHRHVVSSVAFSPDGRTILTAGFDKTALIYEVAEIGGLSFTHDGFIRAMLFSPDGQTILTASEDHTARLWNAATGAPIGKPLTHGGPVEAVAFGPDGRTVLTGSFDNTARLWNASTGNPLAPPLQHGDHVQAVAFSPRGDRVVTGSNDKTARLWNAVTGEPLAPPLQHGGHVDAVAFSPNGRTIITASEDTTARLWNSGDGTPIGLPLKHDGPVKALAFSPDGQTVITGSDDMRARLWEVASGKLRIPPLQHDGPVSVAAYSPDGRIVITGGWDRVARLWDATTGTPIIPPLRHDGTLRAFAFGPDGRTVITGSYDRKAQLWDIVTGKPIGPAFLHENQVWFVAFSPDGRTVISGGQENKAHLWVVPSIVDAPIADVERSVQVSTGMELLDDGSLHILGDTEWNERRARLGTDPLR